MLQYFSTSGLDAKKELHAPRADATAQAQELSRKQRLERMSAQKKAKWEATKDFRDQMMKQLKHLENVTDKDLFLAAPSTVPHRLILLFTVEDAWAVLGEKKHMIGCS